MSVLYITENGIKIGINGGVVQVTKDNEILQTVPKETIDSIFIFGNAQMTTQCIKFCLEREVHVSYHSMSGKYFGCLHSVGNVNVKRLKTQVFLSEDTDFPLEISKKIIEAKINNQLVVGKRYLRNSPAIMEEQIFQISNSRKKAKGAKSIEQLMGYEGIASRNYFEILSEVIDKDFKFSGRNRRPPSDPFNAMLSFGYTMIMNEIYGILESRGLNPFVGFLHQDKEKHPTLASDIMEEWRPVIVDSVVMSLVQGHEISINGFYYNEETGACLFKKDAMKIFLEKMEKKMRCEVKYLDYIVGEVDFRHAMWHQIGLFIKALENNCPEEYIPFKIR